jgi:Holliday junction resolvase RusA-like endonuclease
MDGNAAMTVTFTVIGVPVPQGSMRAFVAGNRAVVTHASPAPLKGWRDSVAAAALEASAFAGQRFPRPMSVRVTAIFRLPRPKVQTKAQRAIMWVSVKPDIDKLGRSLLDALAAARVFDDDSQVASLWVSKLYADDDESLGATVTVSAT